MVSSTEFEEEIFDQFDILLDLIHIELSFEHSFEFRLIRSSFGTRSASVDKDTIKGLEEIYLPNKNVSLV